MSLIRQLWLAVAVVMALTFLGAFLISTAAARNYLTQQLQVKNIDNATALALSISQMPKDQVTLGLLISAQFDAGHYRLIRLSDPNGKTLIERRNGAPVVGVPAWFVAMIPIQVAPGIAQIQDGWHQYGTLTVESHDQYAYVDLWQGCLHLLFGFVAIALAVAGVGSLLLHLILRPLAAVVDQAEAIRERRFITQREPRTLELRRLVRTMNQLSGHVQKMLDEESRRVEQLRLRAQTDPVTGLSNRDTFMAAFEDLLERDEAAASGSLLILRVAGLAGLNQRLGRPRVDAWLKEIGQRLRHAVGGRGAPWPVARLNAGDFAVLADGENAAEDLAQDLAATLASVTPPEPSTPSLHIGATRYHRHEARSAVLARADSALAIAEQRNQPCEVVDVSPIDAQLPTTLVGWRSLIETALQTGGLRLARFPVRDGQGRTLHYECPMRLRVGDDWVPAGLFVAWATRLGLMPALDLKVLEAALAALHSGVPAVSITVSPEALRDEGFLAGLRQRLMESPDAAARLWLEVPEQGALRQIDRFRAFSQLIRPMDCRLGLKQAGSQFVRIAELHDLGLDYLKIDGTIVRAALTGSDHQAFLRGLCVVAHAVGITTIAAGLAVPDAFETLIGLGVDGFTGPAVRGPEAD